MKFVYIHSNVEDEQLLLLAFKADCVVKKASECTDVLGLCEDVSHFAFVYKHTGQDDLPFFEDREPSAYPYFNQGAIDLFQGLKARNPAIIIDILTCNLNKPSFASSVAQIQTDLGINIRYSLDQTGNAPEGNWVLESDGVDVKDLYFTELITMWNGVLDVTTGAISGNVARIAYDDTYIYIGGSFTIINGIVRNRIARYTKDGRLDMTWNPNANNTVGGIVTDDTYIYIGGAFTTMNGNTTRNRLARIPKSSATGIVDPLWNPSLNDQLIVMVRDDTHLYFGGYFSGTYSRIARIPFSSTTGALDATWRPNVNAAVWSIAVDATHVYFGGDFTTVNGSTLRNYIARTPKSSVNGTVDTWDPNLVNARVLTIAVNDTHIYFGGTFLTVNSNVSRNRIARIPKSSLDGTVDALWNPNVNSNVWAIAIDDTNIYIGGIFTTINGSTERYSIARIPLASAEGIADSVWNPNGNNLVRSIVFDGANVYISGDFSVMFGGYYPSFVIYNKILDQVTMAAYRGFSLSAVVRCIAYDTDYVYVGGEFTTIGNIARNRIARFSKSNGMLDLDWNPTANDTVHAIAVDSTYIYIGGIFTIINSNGIFRNRIVRIPKTSANGAIDQTWNPNSNGSVFSIVINATHIYVAGGFTTMNGNTRRNRIARIPLSSANGTVDADWNPNADVFVNVIAIDSSNVYMGGFFTIVNGSTSRNYLARIPLSSTTGTVDASWNPNPDNTVRGIVIDSANIYIRGTFATINGGTVRNRIARIPLSSTTGTVDADWNPNANNLVDALAVDGTNVYIGGDFTTINGGTPRNYIARIPLSSSTGVVDSWNPNASANVQAIVLDGTNIYIGGFFTNMLNTVPYDLFGIGAYFNMTNPYITSSRTVLANNGISNQSAITSKVVNQGDLVTDVFVDFNTIATGNKADVRHALLSLLQEYNFNTSAFYMPKGNLGLPGSGNTLVYLPYQSIDVATFPTGSSAYINLYMTGDYITFTSGATSRTITKTATGYVLDGVTYVDGDTLVLYSFYPVLFGGVYIPSVFDMGIQMIGQGQPAITFQGSGYVF